MNKVDIAPHPFVRATIHDLRELMRDQQVNSATLAWILRCTRLRAFRLRHGSTSWTIDEIFHLVDACAPVSASVPVWGRAVSTFSRW